jgi:molecular chaperone DnaK (HSP70)
MLENIDKVILTGGPMTMPVVRRMAADEFGNRIVDGVDPMMCVAAGAAIKPTATGAIAPPSHNIYLSIEGSRTSLKVEEVVTIFESLPTEKLFQWTVQPSEPEIRIQVLQEPQRRSSKNVYLTTAKYVFSITPPTGRKDYFLLCSVGTEEDKITVTVFDSRVEAEKVLENQNASREVPFRFRRFKDMGEIKIATGITDVKDEKERVREAFWFRAPLVQSILGESTDLWRAAKALSRAGYRPPPSLENMAMMAENLFNVVYHRIDSQLQMISAQNLPDHELERSVSALADRIMTNSEFRTLSQLTNSNDWKERMREWTVPETGIRSLVEAIANMKVEAKSALDKIKPENSTEDKQRIERLLNELDSIQSRLQGAGEVSVLSTNGRLFIEGKTKLEQLRSWVDAL